jgi:hypothetical protein
MTAEVVTLYKNPPPIEINVDLEDEEMRDIIRIIKMAPRNCSINFLFKMQSGKQVLTVSSEIVNNNHSTHSE